MPSAETLARVDAFWAGYFGCGPEELREPRTRVLPHKALVGYEGALVFRREPSCVVSVPESVPEIERAKLRAGTPEQIFDPSFLARVFVLNTDKVAGPAWVGLADRSDFRPGAAGGRPLGEADEDALQRLAEACGEAWKQSKLVVDLKPLFGRFEGPELAAVSGYRLMGDLLAYVGVISHPERRGRGYARSAVTSAMEDAFSKGYVAMWRTPEANTPAVRLAESLGFGLYARTYDVQLAEDEF